MLTAHLINDEDRWKKYVNDALIETSISKDSLMLTRVDKPALLRKLFHLGCLFSGQVLSYTKIVGQLQDAGNTTTLAHYLHLLDTAGLLAGIEKYTGEQLRQRSSSPKFQVHNTALLTAQHGASLKEVNLKPDVWGRWVEAAIKVYIRNAPRTWYDPRFDASPLWAGVDVNMDMFNYVWGRVFRDIDITQGLKNFHRPVFLALGRHDFQIAPPSAWDPIAPKFRNLTVHTFERSGHTPPLEEAALFDEQLLGWMNRYP